MQLPLQIALAAGILAGATAANAQMRYQAMDTNRDGVVSRDEWRGTDRAFRNEDWNGDGVLSGDEVRQGARRQTNWSQDWNRDGRVDNLDSQIFQRFRGYDMNNDNRVARSEWPGDQPLFTRLDTSRDGYLSIQEYTQGGGFTLDSRGGPSNRFSNIDMNNDGWVTRNEWNMGSSDFTRLDLNRDNRISGFEFENDTAAYNDDRFATVDVDHDGWLRRSEWRGSEAAFTRLDTNRDNRLSRSEYDAEVTNETARSAAWRAGHDRGTQEGRAAGREDLSRRQGWDLEGQRELELADSGYTPQVGTLSDYQAGYREGFRDAYRAGFTEAGGRAR
jgi:hypothetical protein